MKVEDQTLSKEARAALGSLVGKRLLSIDAFIVARGNLGWSTIRLHFDDSAYNVANRPTEFRLEERGLSEDIGVLLFVPVEGTPLEMNGMGVNMTSININQRIEGVTILNDSLALREGDDNLGRFTYTQAIIFRLAEGYLVLDKEQWFSEMIAVKRGGEIDGMIFDDAPNWETDSADRLSYDYSARIEKI